ncbi:MAG TPA: thioesterase family protein [Thermoleophilaceae bacterium]|nr:thioesterase family protein [Thermoleophilaceae bacterium]
MGDFEHDTTVRPRGDGVFDSEISPDWWVVAGPNGGYIGAIIVRALSADPVLGSRPLRSVTIHYLGRPQAGPAEVHVETDRHGRSVSFSRARLGQAGRTLATAAAVFADDRPGLELDGTELPRAPSPDEIEQLPDDESGLAFARKFDYRPAIGGRLFSGADEALTGGWIRFRDERPLDAAALVTLCDAWFPAVFAVVSDVLPVPTLELTVHLRGRLPRPRAWTLGRWTTKLAREGFLEESAEIYSREGELLAHSRQLALAG